MEFDSIRRDRNKKKGSGSALALLANSAAATGGGANSNFSRRKTFSTSNLSSISNTSSTSASIGRKTLCLTLPENFGAKVSLDGRIQGIIQKGPAHASGLVQIGDYIRILDNGEGVSINGNEEGFVTLHVTYGILQVDQRPHSPFIIEIGNRSYTSLGLALTDSEAIPERDGGGDTFDGHGTGTLRKTITTTTATSNKRKCKPKREIRISSIQRGSLADRCGFLRPGDILTSIHVNGQTETIPCSPYYTSYQMAQILRKLTSSEPSITLTVVPEHNTLESNWCRMQEHIDFSNDNVSSDCGSTVSTSGTITEPLDMSKTKENNQCVLSLCLWKDSSFDDWGFSIVDEEEESESEDPVVTSRCHLDVVDTSTFSKKRTAVVQEMRRGGPAFLAGLRSGDRILQINERDVSTYESTILVPVLASLEDALNIVVLRNQ